MRIIVALTVAFLASACAAQKVRHHEPAPAASPSAQATPITSPTLHPEPTTSPTPQATSPMAGGSEMATGLAGLPAALIAIAARVALFFGPAAGAIR